MSQQRQLHECSVPGCSDRFLTPEARDGHESVHEDLAQTVTDLRKQAELLEANVPDGDEATAVHAVRQLEQGVRRVREVITDE